MPVFWFGWVCEIILNCLNKILPIVFGMHRDEKEAQFDLAIRNNSWKIND